MAVKVISSEKLREDIEKDIRKSSGDVGKWLKKITEKVPIQSSGRQFIPSEIAVQYDGRWHYLRMDGKGTANMKTYMHEIMSLPYGVRHFPNATASIQASIIDGELYINLDGEMAEEISVI